MQFMLSGFYENWAFNLYHFRDFHYINPVLDLKLLEINELQRNPKSEVLFTRADGVSSFSASSFF